MSEGFDMDKGILPPDKLTEAYLEKNKERFTRDLAIFKKHGKGYGELYDHISSTMESQGYKYWDTHTLLVYTKQAFEEAKLPPKCKAASEDLEKLMKEVDKEMALRTGIVEQTEAPTKRIEYIHIAEHMSFNKGRAIEVLCSSDEVKDLKKALGYLNREIQRLSQ